MLHLTINNFDTEVKQSSLPVVVMFYAVWCGKCAMMTPVIEELEEKHQNEFKFCKVEIDESAILAAEYETDIVPAFVLFQDGMILNTIQGIISESSFEHALYEIFRNS